VLSRATWVAGTTTARLTSNLISCRLNQLGPHFPLCHSDVDWCCLSCQAVGDFSVDLSVTTPLFAQRRKHYCHIDVLRVYMRCTREGWLAVDVRYARGQGICLHCNPRITLGLS
jgi:hypothetical protein